MPPGGELLNVLTRWTTQPLQEGKDSSWTTSLWICVEWQIYSEKYLELSLTCLMGFITELWRVSAITGRTGGGFPLQLKPPVCLKFPPWESEDDTNSPFFQLCVVHFSCPTDSTFPPAQTEEVCEEGGALGYTGCRSYSGLLPWLKNVSWDEEESSGRDDVRLNLVRFSRFWSGGSVFKNVVFENIKIYNAE